MKSYISADRRRRKPSWSSWSYGCQVRSVLNSAAGGRSDVRRTTFGFFISLDGDVQVQFGGIIYLYKYIYIYMKTSSVTSQTHTTLKIPLVRLRREQTTYFLGLSFSSPCCFCSPPIHTPWAPFRFWPDSKQTNKQTNKMSAKLSSDQTPCSVLIAPLTPGVARELAPALETS